MARSCSNTADSIARPRMRSASSPESLRAFGPGFPQPLGAGQAADELVLDLEYIRHGSLLLDLRIIFCTLFRLVGLPTKSARRLLRVYCSLQRLTEDLETVIDRTMPDLKAWSGSACDDIGRKLARCSSEL
ncbi:MAG: hypothetical protein HY000_32075 [Planctomycetes bacterium]|nr:hypothetical protein [Planctomycetota bacterium]